MQQSALKVLAGPVLKKLTCDKVTLWLVTNQSINIKLSLTPEGQAAQTYPLEQTNDREIPQHRSIEVGEHLYIHLLHLTLDTPLPTDCWIGYQLAFTAENEAEVKLTELLSDICYPRRSTPGFVVHNKLRKILHGSCRKPHHDSPDGLVIADNLLATLQDSPHQWPSLLMMTGDQIYADDVATPMLAAIHSVIPSLGIDNEIFADSTVADSHALHGETALYNQRMQILPNDSQSQKLKIPLFKSAEKPVFTTVHANNHLVSFAEVMAMYLLCWSPECWATANTDIPNCNGEQSADEYLGELALIEQFVSGLSQVRRVMAHLPCPMMFDDHDVTDDWNLTADWEQAAYGNVFSRRIIGNSLMAYLLCQGWGNAPQNFSDELLQKVQLSLQDLGCPEHDETITKLLEFEQWHYQWPTSPKLLVLDTRTQRWWSESNANKPSGLMDWESLTELQQALINEPAVVLVSPAPIFGVKLIEAIQRVFTRIGKPLVVDAENWMAHPGSANYLLNLFTHRKTPQNFVILSGDVHYSYAYHVKLKRRRNSPDIWQITSSGLRNTFPEGLLNWLDRLNRWLYAPYSPLNVFTKRRSMRVTPLKPSHASAGERLVNGSGIGLVEFDDEGKPTRISQLLFDQQIQFEEADIASSAKMRRQ
ncbi:alkaline phosphatase D family protein [Paraglaciecola mesophila]|uniref:Alkaline phosphatase D family protein n=1 Tax=Paraglaciecola mesophila TaxID=197222 RepID=A0ABU9SR86_9ALTE